MKTVYKVKDGKIITKEIEKGRARGWFYTEKEAINHYNECVRKFNDFKEDLVELLSKHKASLDFYLDGDKYGIYDEKMTVSMVVGEEEVQCDLSSYGFCMDSSDVLSKEEEFKTDLNSSPKI